MLNFKTKTKMETVKTAVKTGINITKATLKEMYSTITAPGTYLVKASNYSRIHDENLGKDKFIVNLRCFIGEGNISKAKEVFNGQDSVDVVELNGLTASANIIINDGSKLPDVPMKNQEVKITVGLVKNKKDEEILAVTAIQVMPVAKAKAFSFDEEEEEIPASRIDVADKTEAETPAKKLNATVTA